MATGSRVKKGKTAGQLRRTKSAAARRRGRRRAA